MSTLSPDVSTLIFSNLNICSLSTCVNSSTDVSTLYIQIQSVMFSCVDSSNRCVDTFNQSFGYCLHVSTPQEHVSIPFAQNIFLYFPWPFERRSNQVLQDVFSLDICDLQGLQSSEIHSFLHLTKTSSNSSG